MRLTILCTWSPDSAETVYRRFEEFRQGKAPKDVKEAFGRLNIIAWEKLATNSVLTVAEGEQIDLVIWSSYWQDLGEFEVFEPSFNLLDEEVVDKITPPAFLRK